MSGSGRAAISALLFSLASGLVGCSSPTGVERDARARSADVTPVVPLNGPFELPFDHVVRLGDTGVRLRFVELLEDSRCPQGVTCVWEGRVRVRLELFPPEGTTRSVALGTQRDSATVTAAGVTLELTGVAPERVQGQELRPEDYVLTLLARRAD